MESFHVIIPARHASERFPGKTLTPIAGKPLVQHVFEAARASGAAQVWVATDDRRIAEACAKFGGRSIMTGEHASGSDRIAEAAELLDLPADAIIVNLQGDEPLTPPGAVRCAAEAVARDPGAEVATLCTRIRTMSELWDPNVVKVVTDARHAALYFSRSPIPYHRERFAAGGNEFPDDVDYFRHVGIYAYRNSFLQRMCAEPPCAIERAERLEQLRALYLGAKIVVVPYGEPIPAGVDVPEDVARIEALLASERDPIRVLFVCTGNICRSPTAQGVAEKLAAERAAGKRFLFDSAGTHGFHAGEPPDPRAQRAAQRRGLDLGTQRARRVTAEDFDRFDYIIVMDDHNYQILKGLQGATSRARLRKMMEFSDLAVGEDVPDPYPGGEHGFEQVLDLLENAVAGLISHLENGSV